jgi:hypothetical protein
MKQSESITQIAKALVLFHIKVDAIKKDAKNPFFKSSYASLSNILEAINEPLTESGLSLAQFPEDEHTLTSILMHESGEWISASYQMKPVKDDPQGRGSCITYQRRYCVSAILNLQIDDAMPDDDGNRASKKEEPSGSAVAEKKWLNKGTPSYHTAVVKLENNEITIEEIEKYYRLNREIKDLFIQIQNQAKNV